MTIEIRHMTIISRVEEPGLSRSGHGGALDEARLERFREDVLRDCRELVHQVLERQRER